MTDLAFNLIMDCGQAMLANGGEVFRAQDTMEIMARSFGIVDFHVYVLTNGIFASAQNGTVSAVRHVPVVSTNLGHVEAINAISRRVADGELDLNSAQLEFERMKRMPTPARSARTRCVSLWSLRCWRTKSFISIFYTLSVINFMLCRQFTPFRV